MFVLARIRDMAAPSASSNSVSVFHNASQPSQPLPAITAISPTSGAVGASVSIEGTNFSATASEITVFFGAVQAAVTSASETELTVEVPAASEEVEVGEG